MKKPEQLTAKVAGYSALAISFLSAAEAKAQIIYTDLNPDRVVRANKQGESGQIYIDLNNDGKTDLSLGAYYDVYGYYIIGERLFKAQIADYNSTYNAAMAFSYRDPIGSNLKKFKHWGLYGYVQWGNIGAWDGRGDHYLGVRLKQNDGSYLYGWIRMTVKENSSKFIVKDYAINTKPNELIYAGQKRSLADQEASEKSILGADTEIKVFPNPANQDITISLNEVKSGQILFQVFNAEGKLVIASNQPIGDANFFRIHLPALPSGMYLLEARNENNIFRTQFMVGR